MFRFQDDRHFAIFQKYIFLWSFSENNFFLINVSKTWKYFYYFFHSLKKKIIIKLIEAYLRLTYELIDRSKNTKIITWLEFWKSNELS